MEDQGFFVGQKAFIEKGGKVLVLMVPKLGLDFPGGKIQVGEIDHTESLRREVREETGLEIEVVRPFFTWYFKLGNHHENSGKLVYLVGFKCKYLRGEVKISDEHETFKWVDKNAYKHLKNKRGHFEALENYFKGT